MKLALLLILSLLASCSSSTIKLTDRFEDHATVIVPSHVECLEVAGKRVKDSFNFRSKTNIEIPVGRTEVVFRFYKIYDVGQDDHQKIRSEKMTAVFIADKNNHYEIVVPDPLSVSEAEKMMAKLEGYLIHRESGTKVKAIRGIIEERYHGIQIKKPYQELKYWWKKATDKEKADFKEWLKEL